MRLYCDRKFLVAFMTFKKSLSDDLRQNNFIFLKKVVDTLDIPWYYIWAFDGNGPVAQVVRAHP